MESRSRREAWPTSMREGNMTVRSRASKCPVPIEEGVQCCSSCVPYFTPLGYQDLAANTHGEQMFVTQLIYLMGYHNCPDLLYNEEIDVSRC